jgi:hypothetical protein
MRRPADINRKTEFDGCLDALSIASIIFLPVGIKYMIRSTLDGSRPSSNGFTQIPEVSIACPVFVKG